MILKDGSRKERKRAFSRGFDSVPMQERNSLGSDIDMMRIRNIDGINMIVTLKLTEEKLSIVGDLKKGKDIKII